MLTDVEIDCWVTANAKWSRSCRLATAHPFPPVSLQLQREDLCPGSKNDFFSLCPTGENQVPHSACTDICIMTRKKTSPWMKLPRGRAMKGIWVLLTWMNGSSSGARSPPYLWTFHSMKESNCYYLNQEVQKCSKTNRGGRVKGTGPKWKSSRWAPLELFEEQNK